VNLDPEALAKVRLLSHQRGAPLGTVISELILKATRSSAGGEMRNGVPVLPRKAGDMPGLDDVNKLRD
jgi:hypothetical protein